jgi:hypothetical protein
MKAVYVDWHLPRKMKGVEIPVKKHWEVVMIIRTAYFSREVNGFSPVLYCDQATYEYYESLDLIKHFDEVFPVLPNDPSEIDFDPTVFWAAAKFLAIEKCDSPFIMIDLDAEIRFKIHPDKHDAFFAHYELVREDDINFYPPPSFLDRNGFLTKRNGIEWGDLAMNTSIIYFKDLDFAKNFASSALDFMRNVGEIDLSFDPVSYILLVEQRLAYELCRIKDLDVGTLISGIYIPREARDGKEPEFVDSDLNEVSERGFLHIWGYKKALNANQELEERLLGDLISSRLNLKDDIIESISRNFEIYMNK